MQQHDAIAKYIAKWHLTLEDPFETNSSWLAFVRRGALPAVLKIAKPESDEHRTSDVLLHWGGPAVRVLEHEGDALLMERAEPGTPLTDLVEAGRDEDATEIWCDTVAALHVKEPPLGWPTIERYGRALIVPWPGDPLLSRALFERAQQTFSTLCATQSPRRFLLHADLHHANIVNDSDRGWLVTDPKGFVGELEFETGSFLRNPARDFCTPRHLEARSDAVADRLNLQTDRMLRWTFVQGVLAVLWSRQNSVFDPVCGIRIAEAALTVLGELLPRGHDGKEEHRRISDQMAPRP